MPERSDESNESSAGVKTANMRRTRAKKQYVTVRTTQAVLHRISDTENQSGVVGVVHVFCLVCSQHVV